MGEEIRFGRKSVVAGMVLLALLFASNVFAESMAAPQSETVEPISEFQGGHRYIRGRWDRREDIRDRREDVRDRREDIWDRHDDKIKKKAMHHMRHRFREAVKNGEYGKARRIKARMKKLKRNIRADRREDRWDRREDVRDLREDIRENRREHRRRHRHKH